MRRKILIALFLGSIFLFPTKVLAATDPILYLKFDDGSGTTPTDSSTNTITTSFTATNPTWSTNVPSSVTFSDPYSLDFTGNGDAVNVTWPSSLNFAATAPRSFSFWYKPVANGEGLYSRIISWSNDQFEIAGTNNGSTVHKIAYYDGNWNETNITLSLGTWYHITFTYDGTTAKFYINNDLQDQHSLAGRALSGTMRIGNRVQQLDEGINGKIDDVRVYNYALNTTQIENLSSGSNNPDGDPSPSPSPTPAASPTPTTAAATSSSSDTTTPSISCASKQPAFAPNLFQISTTASVATVYFTPVIGATGYVVSYGNTSAADQYNATFDSSNTSGVTSFQIGSLAENTTYFFKVRGMNGCAPGDWSQTLRKKTAAESAVPIARQERVSPSSELETESHVMLAPQPSYPASNPPTIQVPSHKTTSQTSVRNTAQSRANRNVALASTVLCVGAVSVIGFGRTWRRKDISVKVEL